MRRNTVVGLMLVFVPLAKLAFGQLTIESTGNVTIGTAAAPSNLTVTGAISGVGTVPIGTVIDWWRPSGSTLPIPQGFRVCDGSLVSDPASPFDGKNLPNLAFLFVRGVTNVSDIGQTGGADDAFPTITIPTGGSHTHTLPAATDNVLLGGTKLCGSGYTTCDDNEGWTSNVHLRVDAGSSTKEGQHRHVLGGSVTGGEHSHTATSSVISTVPRYYELLKLIRIK